MRKLFKEILGSKIIALLLIFGTVILSLYAVYFNARADENIHSHRYDYGQTGSKEEIQKRFKYYCFLNEDEDDEE